MIGITFRATEVQNHGNGLYTALIEAREMTIEEQQLFNQLFPNFPDQAMDILAKEALFASIVPANEVDFKKEERKVNKKSKYDQPMT
jgi:hypothetical protein